MTNDEERFWVKTVRCAFSGASSYVSDKDALAIANAVRAAKYVPPMSREEAAAKRMYESPSGTGGQAGLLWVHASDLEKFTYIRLARAALDEQPQPAPADPLDKYAQPGGKLFEDTVLQGGIVGGKF